MINYSNYYEENITSTEENKDMRIIKKQITSDPLIDVD